MTHIQRGFVFQIVECVLRIVIGGFFVGVEVRIAHLNAVQEAFSENVTGAQFPSKSVYCGQIGTFVFGIAIVFYPVNVTLVIIIPLLLI